MAPAFRSFLLALCVRAALSETPAESDVSLLQKGLILTGEPMISREGRTPPSAAVPEQQKSVPLADTAKLFVDLDEVPEKRWRNVTRYYTELGVYPRVLQIPSDQISFEAKALLKVLQIDEEYMRELRGMVADFEGQLIDPQATLESLILVQVAYELSGFSEGAAGVVAALPSTLPQWFAQKAKETGCSGLLAAMPDGTVVHGRNMDYHGFEVEVNGKVLHYPEVTTDVTFVRSGKPFITSTLWPGSIGFHTAMRYGGWSFEQNTRFHGMDSSYIYGLLRGSQGYALWVRKIMETEPDFEKAITKLYALNLMAPQYFIMAGPKPYQGAVVTMDRGGEHVPSTPLVTRLGALSPVLKGGQNYTGSWHIIQTNDDQGGSALDTRRPTEEARLLQSTQDLVSVDWVASQLTEPPIYNDGTVFTTVYVPSTGYHKTLVHFEHER